VLFNVELVKTGIVKEKSASAPIPAPSLILFPRLISMIIGSTIIVEENLLGVFPDISVILGLLYMLSL
jgi:hypothetical protein